MEPIRRRANRQCMLAPTGPSGTARHLVLSALAVSLIATALLGCARTPAARRATAATVKAPSVLISAEQAQRAAAKEAERVYGTSFEVEPAELVEERYWRVVVDLNLNGAAVRKTNSVPDVLTREQAETLVREYAQRKLEGRDVRVSPAELIRARCWRVYVWRVPAVPDGYLVLKISATDGLPVETFSLFQD